MSTTVKLLLSVCAWCGTTVAPPADESQRRQYEEWLAETQQLLQMQQRLLEDQMAAHRKTKKSLSAKQRTAKKAGRALAEDDAAQLRHVTELQGTVQKQLEQVHPQPQHHPPCYTSTHTRVPLTLLLCNFVLVKVEMMLISDPKAAEKPHRVDRRLQEQTAAAEGAATAPHSQPSCDASETQPAWWSAPPGSRPQHQRWLAVRGWSSWCVCTEGTSVGSA